MTRTSSNSVNLNNILPWLFQSYVLPSVVFVAPVIV